MNYLINRSVRLHLFSYSIKVSTSSCFALLPAYLPPSTPFCTLLSEFRGVTACFVCVFKWGRREKNRP